MTTAAPAPRIGRDWHWVVAGLVLFAAALRAPVFGPAGDTFLTSYRGQVYQAATLAFNWIDLGPVRRGLGGTVARLLSDDPLLAAVFFHVLAAGAVAVGMVVLMRRRSGTVGRHLAVLLVAAALMLRWSDDFGRTDIAIAALFVGATITFRAGRTDWAAGLVAVSVLVHETGYIFGLPLLGALWLVRPVQPGGTAVPWRSVGLLVAGAVAWAAVARLSPADPGRLIDLVRSRFEPHFHLDTAIYYATSGWRGVETSLCQNRIDPLYLLHLASALAVMAVVAVAVADGRRRTVLAIALAAVPPFLFLYLVANDMARWTMLSSLNIWLVSMSMPDTAPARTKAGGLAVAASLAFLVLSSARLENSAPAIYIPSPALERAARFVLRTRTPPIEDVLPICDPDWRTWVGERVPRAAPP